MVELNMMNLYRTRRRTGFSLIEVLIAIFVTVVGISGVTATIWWATKNQDVGREITEATNIGRMLTESIMASSGGFSWGSYDPWPDGNSGVNDSDEVRRDLFDPPFELLGRHMLGQSSVEGLDGTMVGGDSFLSNGPDRFKRNIQITKLGHGSSSGTQYSEKLAHVKVTVYWESKGIERNVVMESVAQHPL